MSYLEIYLCFVKLGCLCVGGGNAMLPLFIEEMVNKRGLLTIEQFGNLVSIAQMTPGPIGVNTATYVGYLQGGIPGAVIGTFGLLTPGVLLVIAAVYYIRRWEHNALVQGVLTGIRPASLGLLVAAIVIFSEMSVLSARLPWAWVCDCFTGTIRAFPAVKVRFPALLICVGAAVGLLKTKINVVYFIIGGAVLGALICR